MAPRLRRRKRPAAKISIAVRRLVLIQCIRLIFFSFFSDIGAMSSSVDLSEWPYHILGVNYTMASVPDEILTTAWEK